MEPLSAVPPDLPRLAVGSFAAPPLDISQAPKSCILDLTQAQAWNCDLSRLYSIQISRVPRAPETHNHDFSMKAVRTSPSLWGAHLPEISQQRLTLVSDPFERRGPAWWLKVPFNKTVLVPEDKFPPKKSKRGFPGEAFDPPKFQRKGARADEGDRPWVCTWPTTLEIFIYPGQNVSVPDVVKSRADDVDEVSAEPGTVPVLSQDVKMLERRYCDGPASSARCRQVVVTDGGFEDLRDRSGAPVETVIAEKWRNASERMAQQHFHRRSSDLLPRDVELTDCGCLWRST